MRYVKFNAEGRPLTVTLDTLSTEVPEGCYEVTDEQWEQRFDLLLVDGVVTISPVVIGFETLRTRKLQLIEQWRNTALNAPVVSSALGTPYTYAAASSNRQNLNDLITLGGGSKFTAVNAEGVKARLLHTHEQLVQIGLDIQVRNEALFEYAEGLMDLANLADTIEDLDSILWQPI